MTTLEQPNSSLDGEVEGADVTGATVGGRVGGAVMGALVGSGVGGRVVGAGVVGGVDGRNVSGHSPHSPIGRRPGMVLLGVQTGSNANPGISMQNKMPGPLPLSQSIT